MKQLNAGDRVRVYHYDDVEGGRIFVGVVNRVTGQLVTLDDASTWHRKQLRRLVKKGPRRRVWIKEEDLERLARDVADGDTWADAALSAQKVDDDDVEFVEARKAKK